MVPRRALITAAVGAVTMAATLAPSKEAHAGGIPTFDAATFGELVALLVTNKEVLSVNDSQLSNLIDQLATLKQQLDQAQQTYNSITGIRSKIENLFSGDVSPRRLAASLNDLTLSGQILNNRIRNRISAINEDFDVMTGQEFYGDEEETVRTRLFDQITNSSTAAQVVAEEHFETAGETLERYDTYRKELGAADDLKASMDLNTRVQIENGMLLSQVLQSFATQNQLNAAQATADLRSRERTERVSGNPAEIFEQ
ncbi:type IV secretion system protein [Pelagibius sp. Alg239-R121]|uniref:type IV secretion system protein n=1 Tax=Pelagibius sp. Alg239-R121 TaxID=2993448 RepID=UPI0024A71557|nr:type IV secretion system protein [Pelagibius sp. Alg239-R121]